MPQIINDKLKERHFCINISTLSHTLEGITCKTTFQRAQDFSDHLAVVVLDLKSLKASEKRVSRLEVQRHFHVVESHLAL